MNVASVEDLEAFSSESFLVVLGDHDLTIDTETDIARYVYVYSQIDQCP